MRRYRVIILESAISELKTALNYIYESFDNPLAAERIERNIWNKIFGLQYMPERSRVDGATYIVRVKRYKIIYEVHGDEVVVTSVRHQLRR